MLVVQHPRNRERLNGYWGRLLPGARFLLLDEETTPGVLAHPRFTAELRDLLAP